MTEPRLHVDPAVADDCDVGVEDLPPFMDRVFPLLFVGLGAVAALGIALEADGRNSWIAVALVAVSVSPWVLSVLGVHLRDPMYAAVVIAPVGVIVVLGKPLGVVDLDEGWPQLVNMLLIGITGQIATFGTSRLAWTTTATAVAIVVVGAVVRGQPLDYTPWLAGVILAVGGGRAFRANVVHTAQLRRAQEALAQQLVIDERRRIAREVHDIVAHTMSVTMLHLTAARLAVRGDPDAAEAALAEAERHGRASMDDIRGVVRLLRTDESAVAPALPDAAALTDLVAGYVTAGSDVRLDVHGPVSALQPNQRLAVYRVVQESLSNAVRHGRDPIDVRVACSADAVEVEVRNDLAGDGADRPADRRPGAGLAGMAERVEALGGAFCAGPQGNRWRVHARIPV